MTSFIEELEWSKIASIHIPESAKQLFPIDDLQISPNTAQYIRSFAPSGIYLHQKKALESYLHGENVCLTTGTASGKSLPFYASAIEHLAQDSSAKILVIYPLKALGTEQEDRWRTALMLAGSNAKVGRIDGQVKQQQRNHWGRE